MRLGALSCGLQQGAEVELKNASGNEVAAAVKQSGVMSSDTMMQPGEWESKVTVLEMNMPGIPAQYAARMKQSIAEHRNEAEQALHQARGREEAEGGFLRRGQVLPLRPFHDGRREDRRGDGLPPAKRPRENMNVSGSYTPTSYSIDTAMTGSGGEQNGMSMKMHVDAQRVGECTGKDD